MRECRSIRSGASGLPYYCAPLVCISVVIELLAVWRHDKPKTKNQVTMRPLCLKTWLWPNPLTKRSHTRNFLSPSALTSGKYILSWHSVTHQGECEHMYIGMLTTNTNATCLSQPHTLLIHPVPTNSNSFGFELSILSTLYPPTYITPSETPE